jgi:hypothetical protein
MEVSNPNRIMMGIGVSISHRIARGAECQMKQKSNSNHHSDADQQKNPPCFPRT